MLELCKGSVWENVKNCLSVCKEVGTRGWLAAVSRQIEAHVPSMPEAEASRHSLQDKSSKLAKLFARALNSRLNLVARSSRQNTLFRKNWLFTFLSYPIIYRPLFPRNVESF